MIEDNRQNSFIINKKNFNKGIYIRIIMSGIYLPKTFSDLSQRGYLER